MSLLIPSLRDLVRKHIFNEKRQYNVREKASRQAGVASVERREPFTVDLMNDDQSVDRNLWAGAGMSDAVAALDRLAAGFPGRTVALRCRGQVAWSVVGPGKPHEHP
jgi:hypothetical protein